MRVNALQVERRFIDYTITTYREIRVKKKNQ